MADQTKRGVVGGGGGLSPSSSNQEPLGGSIACEVRDGLMRSVEVYELCLTLHQGYISSTMKVFVGLSVITV